MDKLLILFPKLLWETKMSIVRREVIRELLKRPGTHLSGQGWSDYDVRQTLQANIDRIMPDADAVFAYKPLGGKDFPALIECRNAAPPMLLSYNEMWDKVWTTQEIVESGCKLAICHHENDAPRYRDVDCRFVHIPHCANPKLFRKHAKPWADRDIPFLLTGVLSPQIYPMRERFAKLIREKKIPGVIHRHPGYRLENVAACDRQAEEYAKMLGRAKVALCCTSRYKYGLCKIVEASMAGCLVVSDLPEQPAMKDLIYPVYAADTDGILVDSLNRALKASGTWRCRILDEYTTARYADRFVSAVSELL